MRLRDGKCHLIDCNTSYYAKGYCKTHYMRVFRPEFAPKPREVSVDVLWGKIVAELGIEGANKRKIPF